MISPVLANAGLPFTIFMLNQPFFSSIATFGLAGIGIILLEAWGLYKRESLNWRSALWNSFSINLFSTLVGILFSFAYAAGLNGFLLIINSCLLSWFLSSLLLGLLAERQDSPQSLLMKLLIHLINFAVSLAVFINAGILNFGIGNSVAFVMHQEIFTINNYITATLGLLIINFLLTVIVESFWLIQHLKEKSPSQLCRTVFWINVRSYSYILLPTLVLGGFLQNQLSPPDQLWRHITLLALPYLVCQIINKLRV